MELKLLGYVGVDSGQLLLCDPGYIDSQWEDEEFEDIRIYQNKLLPLSTLQYKRDFAKYDEIIPEIGQCMNDLIKTGEWEQLDGPVPVNNFSYNACCKATLEHNNQLNYKLGHAGVGVAFSTQIGDGSYPVYAIYDDGVLMEVKVIITEQENLYENE